MVIVITKLAKLGPSYKKQTYFLKNDNICYLFFFERMHMKTKTLFVSRT